MAIFSKLFSKKRNQPSGAMDQRLETDFHSHLIPGIDDGVKTIEDSLEILRELSGQGIKKVITTPHVIQGLYPNTTEIIREGERAVRAALEGEELDIQFGAAAEYYLDDHFVEEYIGKEKDILTFGDNYVLFETGFMERPPALTEIVFELSMRGYKPIMAHPERYRYLLENFSNFEKLKENGLLFQSNLLSFTGHYSPQVKKAAEFLLKNKMIDAVGSDIHKIQHALMIRDLKRSPVYSELMELNLLNSEF